MSKIESLYLKAVLSWRGKRFAFKSKEMREFCKAQQLRYFDKYWECSKMKEAKPEMYHELAKFYHLI
jgi:hypothetical protein